MNQSLLVTKRDGRKERIDLDKIHRVITWAAEGLHNVSVSQVELRSHIQFYDGIRTSDIHETIIKAAADLISRESPDYQYLAARLAIFHLRKKAYGQFEPPKLLDHVRKMVELGKYDAHLLQDYSEEEFAQMDEFLDHWRDMNFSYAAVKQLEGKYLVQNRVTGEIYESAQFLYILVAACLFAGYPRETRLDYVRRFYDAISTFKISLPTPIMSGVRTPTRQFSSCVLIECGDSLDSINATSSAIVKYVSQRAGIGINAGRIRALGSEIRGGEAFHTGCIPFYKHFQTAVKSCSQGGVRGGAATLFYPLWHLEVEDLLVLKNNRGVEENRVRHMDYGVQINKLMYQRLIKGENITLFSPSDVPGLYDAFFMDQAKFEELYVKYEQDPSIRKKAIKALELFSLMMQERASTGRIYIQNVDHCNTHSPFDPMVAPVRQSNLCLEIALPTRPLDEVNDANGEIALCTLSAFNLGAIEHLDELEELAELAIRALDSLLDYQDYPIPAAQRGAMGRRTLGIGVINFAYYLAKHGVRYSDGSANNLTHR
ncbi:MAG: class 1a ribonucleoside-diphosphate reductase subunit alpha, partial [Plesiomonas shigelloides]